MWPRTVLVHGWFWLFWWVPSSSSNVILFAGWQELVIAWKCAVFCCHYVSCLVVGFHWKLFQSTMAFVESSLKALQKHEKLNFANNYCTLGGPSFQRRSRGPPTSATLFHCTSLWILMHIFLAIDILLGNKTLAPPIAPSFLKYTKSSPGARYCHLIPLVHLPHFDGCTRRRWLSRRTTYFYGNLYFSWELYFSWKYLQHCLLDIRGEDKIEGQNTIGILFNISFSSFYCSFSDRRSRQKWESLRTKEKTLKSCSLCLSLAPLHPFSRDRRLNYE